MEIKNGTAGPPLAATAVDATIPAGAGPTAGPSSAATAVAATIPAGVGSAVLDLDPDLISSHPPLPSVDDDLALAEALSASVMEALFKSIAEECEDPELYAVLHVTLQAHEAEQMYGIEDQPTFPFVDAQEGQIVEAHENPASRSFIQGLEPVTLGIDVIAVSPYCAVCLEDFDQEVPTTQLPCTHPFHLHCIVQCLELRHLCPLCRFAMPTEED